MVPQATTTTTTTPVVSSSVVEKQVEEENIPLTIRLLDAEPDSDDDSDYYEYESQEEEDSEDEEEKKEEKKVDEYDPIGIAIGDSTRAHDHEQVIHSSLQAMLSLRLQSRSRSRGQDSDQDVNVAIDVEAHNETINKSIKNLLSCENLMKSRSVDNVSADDMGNRRGHFDGMIKQSVRNILAMKSNDEVTLKDIEIDGSNRSTSNSPAPLVHPEIQNIKSYQSFASASDDLGSDDLSAEEEAAAIELSLRALLSFRSMALTLREEAKRFRAELREMTFDSDHEACKDTCSYIRYKINKIIGLNTALSKFANENALSILNPFADKNDLTETFNTHLRGLLKCIMKTKLDRITVSGPNSRKASAGIAAIYKLIAGLSPAAAAIADVTKVISDKIVQYDLNQKREELTLGPQ
jgi:hypothetical protein